MYDKPLPVIDPDSAPYWRAAKEHRLLLKRCSACGKAHFYPRELCPHCHSDAVEWIDAKGTGSVYSYTVARRPAGPAFKPDAPYVVAIVELDEGARMMTNIVGCPPESVRIGQRVVVAYEDVTDEVSLPKFRVEKMSEEVDKALKPEPFAALIKKDFDKWGPIVKASGAKID